MATTIVMLCGPQLKAALAEILGQPGAAKPERVRFFRGQMQTIITRAVTDLDIKPVPSRRCFTLISESRPALPSRRAEHVLCCPAVPQRWPPLR